MTYANNRTLKEKIQFKGVGLHSGCESIITIHPTKECGLRFTNQNSSFTVSVDRIFRTQLCTVLKEGDFSVSTTEHLLAALFIFGINSAEIELTAGDEIPILDGSAEVFCRGIEEAGIATLSTPRTRYRLRKPFHYEDGQKVFIMEPSNEFSVSVEIDFAEPAIGRQKYRSFFGELRHIANARTFGLMREVEWMKSQNLARGGSLENAIIVDGDRILNPGGLHHPKEFAMHKLLDLLGDFSVFGNDIVCSIKTVRSGHDHHAKALRLLQSQKAEFLEPF